MVERGCLAFFGFLAFFLACCDFVGPLGRYIIYKVAKMGRVGLGSPCMGVGRGRTGVRGPIAGCNLVYILDLQSCRQKLMSHAGKGGQ